MCTHVAAAAPDPAAPTLLPLLPPPLPQVLIYNRVLAASEVQAVEAYLNSRYIVTMPGLLAWSVEQAGEPPARPTLRAGDSMDDGQL